MSEEAKKAMPAILRPLVAVHPLTGKEACYVPGVHIAKVMELGPAGKQVPRDELVPPLLEYVTQKDLSYAHQWVKGDAVVWDNRCTLHSPSAFDDSKYTRHMWRLTFFGPQITPSPKVLGDGLSGSNGAEAGSGAAAAKL